MLRKFIRTQFGGKEAFLEVDLSHETLSCKRPVRKSQLSSNVKRFVLYLHNLQPVMKLKWTRCRTFNLLFVKNIRVWIFNIEIGQTFNIRNIEFIKYQNCSFDQYQEYSLDCVPILLEAKA